jgi:hypothetical protein
LFEHGLEKPLRFKWKFKYCIVSFMIMNSCYKAHFLPVKAPAKVHSLPCKRLRQEAIAGICASGVTIGQRKKLYISPLRWPGRHAIKPSLEESV